MAADDDFVGPLAPPPARTAIAILRARFPGLVPDAEDDPRTLVGDPTGSLELKARRDDRIGELADNLAVDEARARYPSEGFVPGEPGRRTRSNESAVMSANVGRSRLQRLSADAAADPYTGDAEQGRVQDVRDALNTASLTVRPELEDAAHAVASRNAFGEFLKKTAEYKAERSPEGRAALDAASRRKVAELGATGGPLVQVPDPQNPGRSIWVRRADAVGSTVPPKLTAQERQLTDAARTTEQLAPELLRLLEEERPGIADDPGKHAAWSDVLPAALGGKIYGMGVTQSENRNRINQLTGYLEASLPRMLAAGRINQQQYADLKMHTPQLGLSDGANYERTRYILDTILPAVTGGVSAGHGGGVAPATGAAPAPAAGGAAPRGRRYNPATGGLE